MKIQFLGTGTSTGIPEIGCECKVCRSSDLCDNRLRASVLLTIQDKNLLIDCGPDFRTQMLRIDAPKNLAAVLITHEHYDHVAGLDDLRPFCKDKAIHVFAEKCVCDKLRARVPYIFQDFKYPGVPNIELIGFNLNPFYVDGIEITPIRLKHYKLPIVGFRIGDFAYLTDYTSMPETELVKLKGVRVMVVDALRKLPHISHQTLDQALSFIERTAPDHAYLTHMSHLMGLHSEVSLELPDSVSFAYDGLVIEI